MALGMAFLSAVCGVPGTVQGTNVQGTNVGKKPAQCWPPHPDPSFDTGGYWLNAEDPSAQYYRELSTHTKQLVGPGFIHIAKTGGSSLAHCSARSSRYRQCNGTTNWISEKGANLKRGYCGRIPNACGHEHGTNGSSACFVWKRTQ